MARPLTPREATEMILANRLRHGGGQSGEAAPSRAGRRPGSAQPQRPAPAAPRSDKKE
jgi:hypothetical protein